MNYLVNLLSQHYQPLRLLITTQATDKMEVNQITMRIGVFVFIGEGKMVNIFLDEYYELAMLIVGLDPDSDDFEDEELVLDLLLEYFSISDYDSFVALVERMKLMVDASVYPFDNYIEPITGIKKYNKTYGSYIPGDN